MAIWAADTDDDDKMIVDNVTEEGESEIASRDAVCDSD